MSSRESDLIGQPRRCRCNKLLLTMQNDTVIIKCGRCKRYMVIQTAGILSTTVHGEDEAEIRSFLEETADRSKHTG